MNLLKRLIKDEEGQAITEYALIIGLILVVVIAVVTGLGTRIAAIFKELLDGLGGTV